MVDEHRISDQGMLEFRMTQLGDGLMAARSPRRYIRRTAVIFLIPAVAVTLIAINAPTLLNFLGHVWAVSDRLEDADAAVVLGGGCEARPAAAAQLYNNGEVKQILLSSADLSCEALTKLGVPAAAIIEFGNRPSNTYEEAHAVALWAEQNHPRRVIVPTEIFSSRRVRWIMRHELGKVGVDARVKILKPESYGFDDWWNSPSGLADFGNEIIKYLYYRVRYWRS
jgi:uncharacterized SAM-binding protein YcdF (DUF218 family)